MELHGRPVACGDCGGFLGTLVKIGEDKYRHKDPNFCDAQRRRDARIKTGPKAKKTKSGLYLP